MSARVMVVDDSPVICKQVRRALSASGFEVIEARDGRDALEKVDSVESIALIVCDVNMPQMDGLEFLAALRTTRRAAVPVVMLTTESEPEIALRARALGAKGWITKPFDARALVSTARKLTEGR